MTETKLDSVAIGSGGTATFQVSVEGDHIPLRVLGDSNASDLTFAVTGGEFDVQQPPKTTNVTATISNFDVTADPDNEAALLLDGLDGISHAEVEITNNSSAEATITVEKGR